MSWQDFERFLREKADVSALAELEANCSTVAALERVELGMARAVGMEEVRASSLLLASLVPATGSYFSARVARPVLRRRCVSLGVT